MATRSATVTVHEVLYDIDGDGPACDGTVIARFRDLRIAQQWAAKHTCYGRPASVNTSEVPRRLAQRWGV